MDGDECVIFNVGSNCGYSESTEGRDAPVRDVGQRHESKIRVDSQEPAA